MLGKKILIFTAILAGAGLALSAWLQPRKVRGLSSWRRVLAKNHGRKQARQLAEEARKRYHALLSERSLPDNPVLRRHVTDHILPGLALYQVLLENYEGDRQKTLMEVDEAFRSSTLAEYSFLLAPMKIMPMPFSIFKVGFGERMVAFPPEGWDIKYIESSKNRIAFNITRCFYLDTLTSYGAPELTPSFCKTDDVMAELLPSSIRFSREHTLGRGDEACDFQYWHARHP